MKKDKNSLKTISKASFNNKLKARDFENIDLINLIEGHFLKKRGYVFKMPKPGESVILLYSGGLDSTIAWSYLIEKYKLHVYPLIISNPKNLGQQYSIRFFSKYFKKKYKNYYHPPFLVKNNFLSPKIKKQLTNLKKMHPQSILDRVSSNFKPISPLSGLAALSPIYGLTYLEYLKSKNNIDIKAIFLAVLAGDGTAIATQTFTYLRKTLFFLDDYIHAGNLQIASIFFEKEIGLFCEKKDIIKLGSKQLRLPLEKTYSCYKNKLINCGSCLACYSRSLEFKKAKIVDKTFYYDKLFIVKKAKSLSCLFKYHLSKKGFLCNLMKPPSVKKS